MEQPTLSQEMEQGTGEPAAFFRSLLRSGLVSPQQLREAMRCLAVDQRQDREAIAEHLIKTGKLSRFQARKVLEGAVLGLLLGPYQVLAPIGKGGMGTVYLARDSRNDQLVALKVLPPKRAREEERLLARFRREMELCQRVSHPHLTRFFEAGEHLGVHYIAMEFIPGRTLYRTVADRGPLPVARAARLFCEVALGLEHAHGVGLIHRDLKPSNIMITPKDHAKVLDLGLAFMEGELSTDRLVVGGRGYVLGTMDYIAPEQAEDSSKVDARSDVYSLGCTLYYALTGTPPFPGGKTKRKLRRHRTEDPTLIEEYNPTIPIPFANLVRKMMAKKPDQRFESAAAVREALLPWISGEPLRPFDCIDDQEYQEAIAVLETVEAPAELTQAPIIAEADAPSSRWGSTRSRRALFVYHVVMALGMWHGMALVLGASAVAALLFIICMLWILL